MMNQSTYKLAILILSVAMTATTTTAFTFHDLRTTASPITSSSSSSLSVVWDPKNNEGHQRAGNDIMSSEDELVVEFPTPNQRTALKKEASKRQARKKLPSFVLPSNDQLGSYSDETLGSIWKLLNEHELVQIKGFARESEERRLTYDLAMKLCLQLEYEQERQINDDITLPVAMLSYKGHSAIIYSPTLDNDHPKKFVLRTSVGQKNTWKARIKKPRDERGQIIKD
ncbi:unnamed protein product [Cylindrotheca closterium]|uniref:Uncharacterized protein n=1 Tax=Cylindrotheca closterium TaxID=2856 RepID=A0AAD2G1B9_9STRA|nr:unnamed protein product [Cylindrotheca closterium]